MNNPLIDDIDKEGAYMVIDYKSASDELALPFMTQIWKRKDNGKWTIMAAKRHLDSDSWEIKSNTTLEKDFKDLQKNIGLNIKKTLKHYNYDEFIVEYFEVFL